MPERKMNDMTEHEVGCTCGCDPKAYQEYKKQMIIRIAISAVFFVVGYIISEFTELPDFAYLVCFIISYIMVAFSIVRDAIVLVLGGNIFNEYLLMSIVSIGALAIKEYHEGCAVVLLFAIGELVQSMAVVKSQNKINDMLAGSELSDEELENDNGYLARLENEVNGNGSANRFISRFAKVYTPAVCLIAVAIVLIPPLVMNLEWREWIYRGLTSLVVGCPCAIVISVPLAFYFAIGSLCRDERNGEYYFKRATRIAKEDIALTLIVKAVVLVLVVFMNRELPIWLAVFSDVGVCLLAILNSLRCAIKRK